MNVVRAAIVVVALLSVSADAAAAETKTTPFKGVTNIHRTAVNVGGATQDYYVIVVDLAEPTLRVAVSPQADRGKTTSTIAKKYKARLAINGSFFSTGFAPCGATRASGTFWTNAYTGCPGTLAFGSAPNQTLFVNTGSDTNGPFPAAAAFGKDAISGKPLLMKNGVSTAPWTSPSHINGREPRTAIGYTAGGKKLVMLVVDGRRAGAAGMLGSDLVTVFKQFGVTDAVNLDGGGSTTLFQGTRVLNRPSDGTERSIASAVMILPATPPPPAADAGADAGADNADAGDAGDLDPDGVGTRPDTDPEDDTTNEASPGDPLPPDGVSAADAIEDGGCRVAPHGSASSAIAIGLAIAAVTRLRRRRARPRR